MPACLTPNLAAKPLVETRLPWKPGIHDAKMPGGCVPGWLSVVNYCFVAFYTLEAFVAGSWEMGPAQSK